MSHSVILEGVTLLLIESNAYMEKISKGMLTQLGIRNTVSTCSSGEAIKVIAKMPKVDVVVCDFDVKPDGGLPLLRLIRDKSQNPHYRVPIIMACLDPGLKDVTSARDTGVTEFIAKPMSVNTLRRAILSALRPDRAFVELDQYVGPDRRRRETVTARERRQPAPSISNLEGEEQVAGHEA